MIQKPHVALVGYGRWGKNLARALTSLDVLHAICDPLQRPSAVHGNIRFLTDYNEILKDPKIDAVVIATPAQLHFKMAKEAILAGKDALVEKPITLSLDEAQELVELSTSKNRIVMAGHVFEFNPGIRALREMIRSGEMGKIHFIESRQVNRGIVRSAEDVIFSLGPHDVSICTFLLGSNPEEVLAVTDRYLREPVTDLASITLKFKENIQAHIFVSWLYPRKERQVTVVGEQKMAIYNDADKAQVLLYDSKFHNGELTVGNPKTITVSGPEPLLAECEHFVKCVQDRSLPQTAGESMVNVMRILDSCHRSIKSGGWVKNS